MAYSDRELLARLIQCEAGGEGDTGMKAVAGVVMNRVHARGGEYARVGRGSIRNIIFQPYQFVCASETERGAYNPQNIFNMRPASRIRSSFSCSTGRVSNFRREYLSADSFSKSIGIPPHLFDRADCSVSKKSFRPAWSRNTPLTQPVSVRFAPENRGPSSKRARSFRHWRRIARFPLLGFPRTRFLSVAENLPLYRQYLIVSQCFFLRNPLL